ncbi:MAG: ABC transporter permease [Limnochordia bacterium]|nr:ABC transporter permease [Limnochordia bacterium]MDD2628835.1 ABC transporter permease [Limnochordia bacterium]MDD4517430.1 ABC transporter permease [Limnochordia bacterium]
MSKPHRLLEYGLTLFVLFNLNFILPRALPGDPLLTLVNTDQSFSVLTAEQLDYFTSYYGLDEPLSRQYLKYWQGLLTGELGKSIYFKEDVASLVLRRLGWTVLLVGSGILLSSLVGVILGSWAAWCQGSWFDRALYFFLVCLAETPVFLIGTLLLFTLGARLHWFPLGGAMTHFASYGSRPGQLLDILHHAALPVVTLALSRLGSSFLLSRNTMVATLNEEFMHTAYLKGLPGKTRLFKHGLKNCLVPVITRTLTSLGTMIGGAVLVENLFAYPGIGGLLQQAVLACDYPLMQGILLVTSISVVTMNLLGDLLCYRLDPRAR